MGDEISGDGGDNYSSGGVGDDVYVVDGSGDAIVDGIEQGRDTVRSSADWWLGVGLQNLVLTGSDAVSGGGTEADNAIAANDNVVSGGDGNDTLTGLEGANTLAGGAGDDVYVVGSADDVTVELFDQGHDTVQASIDWALGSNLEDLVLTGSEAISGTGNELANDITGNSGDNYLYGDGGDDVLVGGMGLDYLDGGSGANTMAGGGDDDAYVVHSAGDVVIEAAAGGTDDIVLTWVDYTLAANVERLYIYGGDKFVGNEGDNSIFNLSDHGVSIDGGAGNDVLWSLTSAGTSTLIGGSGDDYYIFSSHDDAIVEAAGGGSDTIEAWHDFDLGAYTTVENLVLGIGGSTTGTGNALDNVITGNSRANILSGLDGNDTLAGDRDGSGGAVGNDSVYGGAGDDRLTGSAGADLLDGGTGNDTLIAGYGADELSGGAGRDSFGIAVMGGVDQVTDFQSGAAGDRLELGDLLTGYVANAADPNDFVKFATVAGGTLVQVDQDGAANGATFVDTVLLQGVTLTDVGQAIADGNLALQ